MNEMDPELVINQDDYDEPEETREFNFNQESNQFDQSLPNVDTKSDFNLFLICFLIQHSILNI